MGEPHPAVPMFNYAGVFPGGRRLYGCHIRPIPGAVIVVEFMPFDKFPFRQEIALFFLKLDIPKPDQLPGVKACAGKDACHFIACPFLVCEGGMQVHKAAALCHNGHAAGCRLPDCCADAGISAELLCIQLWIPAANEKGMAPFRQLFIPQRRKIRYLGAVCFQQADIVRIIKTKRFVPCHSNHCPFRCCPKRIRF